MISFAIALTTATAAATATCCHIRSSPPFLVVFQCTRDSIYIMASVFLHTKIAHALCHMNFTKMIGSLFSFVVRFRLLLS